MAKIKDPEKEKELRQALLDKLDRGEDASTEQAALYEYNRSISDMGKVPVSAEKDMSADVPEERKGTYESYREMLENAARSNGGAKPTAEISSYLTSLQNRYDSLLNTLKNGNYRDYELYDEIVSDYDRKGEAAARSAHADAAADNAGNISSLGAANAHRQRISYKNAGEAAARDAYNDYVDGLVSGTKAYGSDMTDALSLLSAAADKETSRTAALLSAYDKYTESARKAGQIESGSMPVAADLSGMNLGERNDAYMEMLMKIYPAYAEEIQNYFHPI